jgi:hypothetical protein
MWNMKKFVFSGFAEGRLSAVNRCPLKKPPPAAGVLYFAGP